MYQRRADELHIPKNLNLILRSAEIQFDITYYSDHHGLEIPETTRILIKEIKERRRGPGERDLIRRLQIFSQYSQLLRIL